MKKQRALCIVLLVLMAYFGVNLISLPGLRARRDDLAFQVDLTVQLTAKQQKEYDQVVAELPDMRAAQADAEARAQEVIAQADELKTRRNTLREEVALLKAVLDGTTEP